ncbi:vWA domain-containing protein [Autumnicola musiva]|uniref:VWA domain-containing protein n=1 Tax=Autumnicola musiva TaxID=3075589 RepID=A0ABU3D9Q4_9FLAO|nr:vWA domain-containing protein [Zunongwangia sp. F117]MDT0678268.1 vWA domain-containing protein [Zunongwangia sp. F117]
MMKKSLFLLFMVCLFIISFSCSKDPISEDEGAVSEEGDPSGFLSSGSGSEGGGASGSGENEGGQGADDGEAGKITAGEWSDLDNWSFWKDLLNWQEYSEMPDYWNFYTSGRIVVEVKNTLGLPVNNVKVEIRSGDAVAWIARTDNFGVAQLWPGLFNKTEGNNSQNYILTVNDDPVAIQLVPFEDGVNEVTIKNPKPVSNKVELAFIVDATGSMSDELEFLKEDLKDVIRKVENKNASIKVSTGTVFYRDVEDDYLVKHSPFSRDINSTVSFINKQRAGGGGDFPEAVHTALNTALTELQWSEDAKSRIAFLLLDAPPHYESQVIDELHAAIKNAAEKGIKLIPVTASGIDKETEFLMRFFSLSTNGTYVFITNHSGIGNEHIEPSIGEYDVELLNELMVRLITKYSE